MEIHPNYTLSRCLETLASVNTLSIREFNFFIQISHFRNGFSDIESLISTRIAKTFLATIDFEQIQLKILKNYTSGSQTFLTRSTKNH
jgi:hypothetical protein